MMTRDGCVADDLAEAQRTIEAAGGTFFFYLGDERHGNFERKSSIPDALGLTYRKMDGFGYRRQDRFTEIFHDFGAQSLSISSRGSR
jgi:hypothetical protein